MRREAGRKQDIQNRKRGHEPTNQRDVPDRVPKPRKHDQQKNDADTARPGANVLESARTEGHTVIDEQAAPRKRQHNLHANEEPAPRPILTVCCGMAHDV